MRHPEIKTALNIPWASNENSWKSGTTVQSVSDAYEKVPLIYRALKLRCNTLSRVPVYVYRGEDVLDAYEFEDSLPLHDLLWKSEASLLLKGASIILKEKNVYEVKKGLQWLNPFTIQTEYLNGELRFWQQLPTGERYPQNKQFWTVEDFLYFREFNPLDDLGFGVSAADVALGDAQITAGMTAFLSKFFGADAVPITMLVLPQGTQKGEVERVEGWFKDKIRGMRNRAARVLGVTGDVKLEKLTNELGTYDFAGVDNHALQGVSDAFDIPQSLLRSDSGANRAISDNDRESFLNDTIIPRCKFFENVLNPFLEEFDQRIEFAPEEMPEMQQDEVQRSDALGKLVTAGVPLLAALDMLGYDLSEEAEKLIEEKVNPQGQDVGGVSGGEVDASKQIFGYHIEQGVVTRNEARAVLGLPPIVDANEDKQADTKKKLTIVKAAVDAKIDVPNALSLADLKLAKPLKEPEPIPFGSQPKQPQGGPPDESIDGESQTDAEDVLVKADLEKWRRKSLKKLRSGKSALTDFESTVIPSDLLNKIKASLGSVKTEAELSSIFNGEDNGK